MRMTTRCRWTQTYLRIFGSPIYTMQMRILPALMYAPPQSFSLVSLM
ncbi:hypothetical protein SUNI508_03638 [Seiridium unicorne]|uniref:Uncharacterized protein n=1 Tax=Seiridium unicorne TaxID=138068 RepID=A0ABR2VB63_9PEZI